MRRFATPLALLLGSTLLFSLVQADDQDKRAASREKAAGFVALFNGKNLEGWIGSTKGYVAEKGVLACLPKGGGNLLSARQYSDFILRFEFKLPPGGNNGLAIRTPASGNPAYAGMELQILDNTAKRYARLKSYQYHGSIYGVVPAQRGHLKPVGEWNSQEVVVRGTYIRVILNGAPIVNANIDGLGSLDGRKHPGLERDKGHIGFMGHGARVEFRNIRIKDLAAAAR